MDAILREVAALYHSIPVEVPAAHLVLLKSELKNEKNTTIVFLHTSPHTSEPSASAGRALYALTFVVASR